MFFSYHYFKSVKVLMLMVKSNKWIPELAAYYAQRHLFHNTKCLHEKGFDQPCSGGQVLLFLCCSCSWFPKTYLHTYPPTHRSTYPPTHLPTDLPSYLAI